MSLQRLSTHASLDDAGFCRRSSGPAFRAFVNTVRFLGLSNQEASRLLGDLPETTYERWVREVAANLARATLERISYLRVH